MLVILTAENVLSPQKVCSGCLLATRQGRPRWYQGHLSCGRTIHAAEGSRPTLYECQMGFKLVEIDDQSKGLAPAFT